jgi:streptogramin lyase
MRSFARSLRISFICATTIAGLASCGGGSLRSTPQVATQSFEVPARRNADLPILKEYRITAKNMENALDLTFDASGSLWVNSTFAYLGKRSPNGHITAHKLPNQRDNYGYGWAYNFSTDSSGRVYFTTYYGEHVGYIEPTGKIVEFEPAHLYAWTSGLTITHDRLWVEITGFYSTSLLEFTLTGKLLKQFPLPSPYCYSGPMTASKDGSLWIGYSANCPSILHVTEKGVVTKYPIVASNGVWRIVNGPDGNVWFAAGSGPTQHDYIGKITPNGTITEYPIPNQADGLAVGPDGNWYLTMPFVGQIAEMTQSGDIVNTITLPGAINGSAPNYQLGSITLGPDGNLWFVEGQRNQVGELKFGTRAEKR